MLWNSETCLFECVRCGHCCRGFFGDNAVYVRHDEILDICKKTGLRKRDFTDPLLPDLYESGSFKDPAKIIEAVCDQIDENGIIHTPGWMLKRRKTGDCIFYYENEQNNKNMCRIYSVRPDLCRTYPFYTENEKTSVCFCEGIKKYNPDGSWAVPKTDEGIKNMQTAKDFQNRSVFIPKNMKLFLKGRKMRDRRDMENIRVQFKENTKGFVFGSKKGIEKAHMHAKKNKMKCLVYDGVDITSSDFYID